MKPKFNFSVDHSKFEDCSIEECDVKYGLPREVKFCSTCVISNQRPTSTIEFKNNAAEKKITINFDKDGVCDACRVSERKKNTDWVEREKNLKELCNRFRGGGSKYDCLVPGSGGKDSSIPATQFPKASKLFEEPIVDRDYFRRLSDKCRSPHLWKYEGGLWQLRKSIF
ncbi:MAG: hypothetical protein H0X26_03900 [Alphaproteobacteria bacterium]|nr:hypothetical protein [Alphaproteobacteria bacterium]